MIKPIHKTPLAIDIVIFTVEDDLLKTLLIRRTYGPYTGLWALPGGFLEDKDGTTMDAAKRILHEKAGVDNIYLEQLYTFDSSGRDPRGNIPTVTYMALVPRDKIIFSDGKNLQNPQFLPTKSLPSLAFDHSSIVKYAIQRLQAKIEYTNAVYALLPKHFRLFDLQKIYEIVLDKKINKRNFQKKFFSLKLIRNTGKVLGGGRHRPARLYEFINHKLTELKRFF